MSSGMICSVCRKQKNRLTTKRSDLIPSTVLELCDTCLGGKKEPRWVIMLVARSKGATAVVDYVKNHRYVGDPIQLLELVD